MFLNDGNHSSYIILVRCLGWWLNHLYGSWLVQNKQPAWWCQIHRLQNQSLCHFLGRGWILSLIYHDRAAYVHSWPPLHTQSTITGVSLIMPSCDLYLVAGVLFHLFVDHQLNGVSHKGKGNEKAAKQRCTILYCKLYTSSRRSSTTGLWTNLWKFLSDFRVVRRLCTIM